ncbi:hypothetical protein [Uliginosibacterium sp. H1]|uniref:hypothetical protein n=1 Tax=Uliginosibacterium sp. H1 TaxID=3114757 RepID=UPI002E16EC5A|nr:hypothetical protein [Uliginosibacterium sp. H1]
MYSDEDLDAGVAAGIFSADSTAAFRAHIAKLRHRTNEDDEPLRLVSSFNDIFVSLACALLLGAVGGIGSSLVHWLGGLAVAATSWMLAEVFVRKRRMALPAILLLLGFVGGITTAAFIAFGNEGVAALVATLVGTAGAWMHWRRFRVPISVAAGLATALGGCVLVVLAAFPEAKNWLTGVALLCGLIAFALALKWDASDTSRQTRRTDVAFWLHLLAAPLIVHPVFAALGMLDGQAGLLQACAAAAIYVLIALVSLCIDRRALMVSALAYVLYAFTAFLNEYGVVSLSFAITAFIIGSALLILSAYWHKSRQLVLQRLPVRLRRLFARSVSDQAAHASTS